jgi:hypothetical protein
VRHARVVFAYSDYIELFFAKVAPHIENRFVLVTNGGDHEVGEPYRATLDRTPNLAQWFAVNAMMAHPRLTAIPIGLGNAHWPHGDTAALARVAALKLPRKSGLYVNFEVATNPTVRGPILDALSRNPFAVMGRKEIVGPRETLRRLFGRPPMRRWRAPLGFEGYLRDLAQWTHCASPPGNGVDCHRTWEALYLGVIPVLTAAPVGLLDGLPHIMLQSFDEATERNLVARKAAITGPLELEKLTLTYWRQRIRGALDT